MRIAVFVFFILMICFSQRSKAQCEGAAGDNRVICLDDPDTTLRLGDTLSPSWGVAPYSYSWACMDSLSKNLKWTASDFLEDTASPNPRLRHALKALAVVLTITDSLGVSCSDTVVIRGGGGSVFNSIQTWATITRGDSVRLATNMRGGIRPHSYTWSPAAGLADPHDLHTWAKPDSTTLYLLEIRDSAGCPIYGGFDVTVWPVSVRKTADETFRIAPNPMQESAQISFSGRLNGDYRLLIYDASGRKVREMEVPETGGTLYRDTLGNGLYFYRFFDNGRPVAQGKLQVY